MEATAGDARRDGPPRIENLGPSDLPDVARLLRSVGLDPAGLEGLNVRLFGVRDGAGMAGSVAYERQGGAVLLRSLAVRADLRGRGLGGALAEFALGDAGASGADEALLLTEGADGFFAAGGWERVARAYVDERFPDSEQVRRICPSSAAAMRRPLSGQVDPQPLL